MLNAVASCNSAFLCATHAAACALLGEESPPPLPGLAVVHDEFVVVACVPSL